MNFQISEVDLEVEYEELFAAEWAAWTHPHQAVWELMFPVLGTSPGAELEAIKNGAAVRLARTKADPYSRWVKIVDRTNGKIVAGALWKFYPSNPYRAPLETIEATWYPEGELRVLATSMYEQLRAWRPRTMATAHAWLNILFTHPDYRNQGLAGRLVEWGTREADRLGLEAYVEASYLGRTVYERHGFVVMHIAEMNFENPSPGKDWVRLVKDIQMNPAAIMWRPAGGQYVKGETVVPWEGQPRSK